MEYECKQCNFKTSDTMSFNKHNWLYHPSNSYEKTWSELNKSGKLSSYNMGYQDDPYY
jgi:hypothetical protein